VVALLELDHRDVLADLDVAEEAVAGSCRGLLVDADHRLDLRVIRGDARPHQAVWGRQPVEHVDLGRHLLVLQQMLGRVEACRPGADDRHAQGVLFRSDRRHASGKG
jgi:hypothetical protein